MMIDDEHDNIISRNRYYMTYNLNAHISYVHHIKMSLAGGIHELGALH